jgi:PAS domain S-box-containing protein
LRVLSGSESWLFQQLVDGAAEGIVVADAGGTIRFWNAGAQTIFGFSAAEAVGQTLDLIIPEPQRARHWAGYRNVMQRGVTRYRTQLLAVPAVRNDGARISLEFSVVLLHGPEGGLQGIAAIIRDVTEAWQQARSLRQRVRSLEEELRALRGEAPDVNAAGTTTHEPPPAR